MKEELKKKKEGPITCALKVGGQFKAPINTKKIKKKLTKQCLFTSIKKNKMSNYTLVPPEVLDQSKSEFLRKGTCQLTEQVWSLIVAIFFIISLGTIKLPNKGRSRALWSEFESAQLAELCGRDVTITFHNWNAFIFFHLSCVSGFACGLQIHEQQPSRGGKAWGQKIWGLSGKSKRKKIFINGCNENSGWCKMFNINIADKPAMY